MKYKGPAIDLISNPIQREKYFIHDYNHILKNNYNENNFHIVNIIILN